jgi:hypothetical protein
LFTKTYARIVTPSLAELDPTRPDTIAAGAPLARSWRAFERALRRGSQTPPSQPER